MKDSVSASAQIRLTLEIQWNASFGEGATAKDIYTTAARECQRSLETALTNAKVGYRILGDIEPMMVIYPVKR